MTDSRTDAIERTEEARSQEARSLEARDRTEDERDTRCLSGICDRTCMSALNTSQQMK